jgi:hypothetical protein
LRLAIVAGDVNGTIESLQPADSVGALNSYFDELSAVQRAMSSIGLQPNETSTEFPNAGQTEFPNALEIPARGRLFI